MPAPKKSLESAGVTPEKIRPLAEKFDTLDDDHKFKKWLRRESARIRDGVDRNLKNWRLWWALDKAIDAPFHQISYTLLRDILDRDYDDKRVESLIEDFGVGHLLTDLSENPSCSKSSNGKKALNLPVFFNIFVPLCSAYHKVRWAKLFNDRNNIPLYKYEPAYSTKENRLRCDIITSRVSVMSNQLGYANDEKDSIFQSLHYGLSIAFPREAWYTEKQKGADGKVKTVREGLRFNMPPPERMYYDMSERLSTINSSTGVAYLGYWHVTKYGDILDNEELWNRDNISFGNEFDIISSSPNFFSNIYPCTLRFPSSTGNNSTTGIGTGTDQENDREREYAKYTTEEKDQAVLLTEHFTTVVPKDVGIGSYEYPVTFRMVMSNYDTPVYIEPINCSPGAYYGYDSEGNRAKNASLTLEILPFQDQVSNILTQWILAVKKNLRNVTFVDKDIVPKEALDELKNNGEKNLRGDVYIPFSSRDIRAQIGDTRQAFYSPQLQLIPTHELQQLIRGILDMLERALQFSAQEIGQAASHEQSATESNIINNHIGNRVRFTGTYIDDGQWAKKKMIYDALMANGDDDIYAEVGMGFAESQEEFEELCKKLKIEIVDSTGGGRFMVKASKDHLLVDAFVANRDGDNRINNPAIAAAASQMLGVVASNEALFMALGPQQVIELVNQICGLLDLPKDFRMKFDAKSMEQATPQIVQQMQKDIQGVVQQIASRIERGEKAVAKAIQDGDKQVAEGVMKVIGEQQQQVGQAIQTTQEGVVQTAEQVQQTQAAVQQIAEQVAMLKNALQQVAQQPPQQVPVPVPVPVQ
jgi:hypothetical protein